MSQAVHPGNGRGGGSLADRLRRGRASAFVGRHDEIAVFRSALEEPAQPGYHRGFAVLYLWGPGGVGKTALLRQFADLAQTAGRTVVWVDARGIDRSPAGFEEAAGGVHRGGQILVVDNFEASQGLQDWIWDDFLPSLPADALIVVAGQQRPDPRWQIDPDWSTAVRVLPIADLPDAEAVALLRARGVPEESRAALCAFAGGHPLALILAAEVVTRDTGKIGKWRPHEPAIKTLLDRLLGDLPSSAHRRALEICAHVFVTREDLLRQVFAERGAEMFAWLRTQPYIEAGPDGLYPHDLVRDLLTADLRWRDPDGWRAMHKQVSAHFLERALTSVGPAVLPSQLALNYLHRNGEVMAKFITWRGHGEVYEDTYRPGDHRSIMRMAEKLDGPSGAATVDYWLSRRPDAFHVYRRTGSGEAVAFAAWLRLHEPDDGENAADPLIAAIWAHARRAGHPRSGQKLAVQRFINVGGEAPEPSAATDLIYMRGVATCMREPDLACTYIHMPDPDRWAPVLDYVDHDRLSGELSSVFVHDWWITPLRPWLQLLQDRLLHGAGVAAERPPAIALARPEFDHAVRELLRNWRHHPTVAASPLIDSRLAGTGELSVKVENLRAAVEEAVDTIQGTTRKDKLHRTLAATFFHGVPTQQSAAQRLGLPFGTYRHQLTSATNLVVEELWRRETGFGA